MSLKKSIAEHGREAAKRKTSATLQRIYTAQRKIVVDIEKNGGVYPYAGGRMSSAEVLRRAGLDRAILQKPTHAALKKEVNAWVDDLKKKIVSGKAARKSVTRRAEKAEEDTDHIYQLWVEAELEYVEQARRLVELEARCGEMARIIENLRAQLGGRAT